MRSLPEAGGAPRGGWVLVWLLAAGWLALALHGAAVLSAVMDEVPHIGAGVAAVWYGDLRFNPEHPPLFKMLAVLPLWLAGGCNPTYSLDGDRILTSWADGQQWTWGFYVLFYTVANPPWGLFLCRLVPIATGLLGALVAWRWAALVAGRRAGWMAGFSAAVLLAFYPEYLGHARYVTFDVPTLVACGVVGLLGWEWWRRGGWRAGGAFAVGAGVLALVKLPVALFAVLVLAVMGGLALGRLGRRRPGWPAAAARWRGWLLLVLATAISGVAFQWAGALFRFERNATPMNEDTVERMLPAEYKPGGGALHEAVWFARRHRLLPEVTLATLYHVGTIKGRPMFLFQRLSREGWPHYFLVTTLAKTPLTMLALLVAAGWVAVGEWRRRPGPARERLVLLLVPFGVLGAMVAASGLNIGHRHILFIYLPWCVLAGVALARWWQRGGRARWAVAGVLGLQVALSAVWHPGQAVYFNLLAGGSPHRGMYWLHDSNIDWGQDTARAIRRVQAAGYEHANLATFGANRPQAWGMPEYRFILPNYPFAVGMAEAKPPHPAWPTIISLNALYDTRLKYPGMFDGEPMARTHSTVIYPPVDPFAE